jgi:hypothetical protein
MHHQRARPRRTALSHHLAAFTSRLGAQTARTQLKTTQMEMSTAQGSQVKSGQMKRASTKKIQMGKTRMIPRMAISYHEMRSEELRFPYQGAPVLLFRALLYIQQFTRA